MRHERGAHGHEGTTVHDYVRILRNRKWIVLVAVVIVPLAAVIWSVRQPPVYQATAEVLLSNQDVSSGITGVDTGTVFRTPERVAQTQAEVAMTPQVAELALAAANVDSMTPGELLGSVSVVPSLNSDLLAVSIRNGDAELATRLANAYAREFTEYKEELDTFAISTALDQVEARLEELEANGNTDSALYEGLVQSQQQLQTIETLQAQSAFVVRSASGAFQVAPKPTRNGIIGLMLGIILGLGLAFLREALDTRIRTADELIERLHIPLLGRLPSPPRRYAKEGRLVMMEEPASQEAEAFRMLRTNFEFANLEHEARVVMITSAVPAEGKSTTAANFAIALARSGKSVTLVDLDLRRPNIHRFFELTGTVGLTQVALGHASLDEALVSIALSESERRYGGERPATMNGHNKVRGMLSVLTSGPIPPDAGEFIGTQAVGNILSRLRETNDVVVVDAPPLLHLGDAMVLTSRVEAFIVVARLKLLRRNTLRELQRLLSSARAQALGLVITGAEAEAGYGYHYGHEYADHLPQGRSTRVPTV